MGLDKEEILKKLESGDYQSPLESIPDKKWDVLIIGAGPAGSIAAHSIAKAGHSVLLLDKESFPREKTCGEGLVQDSIKCLTNVGFIDDVRTLGYSMPSIRVYSPSWIEIEIPGEYITLKRRLLDSLLASKAVEAGATFCKGEVEDVKVNDDGSATATVGERSINARVCMVATGAGVKLAEKIGLITRSEPSALSVRCYVRSGHPVKTLVTCYERSILPGYGWIFPMGNDEYNVGLILFGKREGQGNIRESFDRFLKKFPLARDLMARGAIISPVKGAPLRCGFNGGLARGKGNIIGIGELLGTTYSFSGEGIGKAMQTGEISAEVVNRALAENDMKILDEYPAILHKAIGHRYPAYDMVLKWLSYPWLNDFMARRINKSKFMQDVLIGFIEDRTDLRDVFSIKGIIRSFLQ